MYKNALVIFAALVIGGCATTNKNYASGNDVPYTLMAYDTASIVSKLYAPANTEIIIIDSDPLFGKELVQRLRSKGFALNERKSDNQKAVNLSYSLNNYDSKQPIYVVKITINDALLTRAYADGKPTAPWTSQVIEHGDSHEK